MNKLQKFKLLTNGTIGGNEIIANSVHEEQ
jgi:hypothetical protein